MNLTQLKKLKARSEPIVCLTAYDASFASLVEQQGVEVILVGDSLGNVIQGHANTVPVSVDSMVYHTQAVTRATRQAWVIADMPFMSYATPERALHTAQRLMQEGLAHMVKLEGSWEVADTIQLLSQNGVPVCAHLGLLPQSVLKMGGYKVQGRDSAEAVDMVKAALRLENAGADMLVLECVPAELAEEITASLSIPVIGIGAGSATDGQVLVLYDMLGINDSPASFVKNFLEDADSIANAISDYSVEVKERQFPSTEHSF